MFPPPRWGQMRQPTQYNQAHSVDFQQHRPRFPGPTNHDQAPTANLEQHRPITQHSQVNPGDFHQPKARFLGPSQHYQAHPVNFQQHSPRFTAPTQHNQAHSGDFQQHRPNFPAPRQPHEYQHPPGSNMHGRFNPRSNGPGMFSGHQHSEIEEFGVPHVPGGYNPRGQGLQGQGSPRFQHRPPGMGQHRPRHMRPPFNGPPGPNCRPRFESGQAWNNNNNSNHPAHRQGHSGQTQDFNKTKKPKVDKRDLPENNQYFCEVCDRGYKDEGKYREHVDGHEKCKYEGCSYTAAPKLVQLHINLQHRTGLAKKIWSLESPEDIKKWREERKKNFPTAENVEKKKAIEAKKIARGEVIEEKYFGKMHQRGKGRFDRGRGRGRGQGRFQGERSNNNNNNNKNGNQTNNDNTEDSKRKINDTSDNASVSPAKKVKKDVTLQADDSVEGHKDRKGKGAENTDADKDTLSYFFNALSDFDSDSEPEEGPTREVTAAGALGSLISSYKDSEENTVDINTTNTTDTSNAKKEEKSDTSLAKNDKSKRRNRNRGRKNKTERNNQTHVKKDNKSLLEKLLAKEMRKERNQILQCVYHVVRNNFFDKPKVKITNGHIPTSPVTNGHIAIDSNSCNQTGTSVLDT